MRKQKQILFSIFLFLGVILFSSSEFGLQQADASHFRYGHITWSPTSATVPVGTEIVINVQDSFRRGYPGTASDGGLAVGDTFLETIGGTSLYFGDGSQTGMLTYKVDAINIVEDWVYAHAINPATGNDWRHTYIGSGPYTVKISSCCRTGVEVNNPNNNYEVSTIVNLSFPNKSPVSTISPIVSCPKSNGPCLFVLPASDGIYAPNLPPQQTIPDTLNFRLSAPIEAGSSSFSHPGAGTANALFVNPSGTVAWDPTTFPLGLYSTSVTLEEGRTGVSPNPHGKVMLDFLINTGDFEGVAPEYDVPPTPENGHIFEVSGGNPLSFDVQCSDADPGDLVTLNTLGLPLGATMEPANAIGNPAFATIKWNTIKSQAATISFTCQDQKGNSALPHSVSIVVHGLEIPSGAPSYDSDIFCNGMTIEQLIASGAYNVIDNSLNPPSTITGSDGSDLIITSGFGDTVFGNDGDDCIIGGVGNDYLLGNSGSDEIYGWNGFDTLDGGIGDDTMFGYDNDDIILGGPGNDYLSGQDNEDVLKGGPGNDTLVGGDDVDAMKGESGIDVLTGDANDDILDGGLGSDTINALLDNDTCIDDATDIVNEDPDNGLCAVHLPVSYAPLFLTAVGDQTLNENEVLNIRIDATDPNPPGSILGGNLSFNGTNMPSFVSITDYGNRTATLHIAPGIGDDNTYHGIVLKVTDDHQEFPLSDYQIISIDVTGGNDAPTFDGTIDTQVMNIGDSISLPISASDSNPGQTLTFSTINLPSFATLTDHGDGTATLDINPTSEEDAGTYNQILITVRDNGLPSKSDSRIIAIVVKNNGNTPPEIDEGVGNKILDVGDFVEIGVKAVDEDGDNMSWEWFDIPSFVTPFDYGNGTLKMTFSPGPTDPGTYTGLAIRVTDDGVPPLSKTELFSITVTGTPVPKGTITIIKDTVPDDSQDFTFNATGLTPSIFTLDDDLDLTLSNSTFYSNILVGNYAITENQVAGFTLADILCIDPDNGSTANTATRTVNIDLDANENIICKFTNDKSVVSDTDNDGILDDVDNCPTISNPKQLDYDKDGLGDACDIDIDNDTILNGKDNCPKRANTDQKNIDGDAKGDACDADMDGDKILNHLDNCAHVANPSQLDTDGDKRGDVCDSDADNDTILNNKDNCPLVANLDQTDTDGDGKGDACDA